LRPSFVAEQTMSMPASARRWTIDEVRAMQDEERAWPRYELIDGELLVTPAPRRLHQRAVGELYLLLHPYVQQQRIGVTELSPADIQLEPGTIVQPDVFVSPLLEGRPPLHWPETTALVLAAEVISPANARADRVTKRWFYTRVEVAEYWVIDLDARIIERNLGADPRPEIVDRVLEWNPPGASEPLNIDVSQYFARVFAEEGAS
jgi:Uma2 family endonuclease